VIGADGQVYTSDQATIWRWRRAFQNDFAARMDWTVKDATAANHNPDVVVNGAAGKAPLPLHATVGVPLTLDAAGTRDPDGHALSYRWFFYAEAGTGIPGQPVASGSPMGRPAARITLAGDTTARLTVTPQVAGTAHVILSVEDDGTPPLTSYRRVILNIRPK
jgi:hypothetical protein